MSQKRLITRIALLLIILFTQLKQGFSQVSISGPTCVVAGTTSLYSFSGSYTNSTNMTWCVSNGTIQQAYGNNITGTGSCRYGTPINMIAVLWNSGGTGTVTLQSSNGDAAPLSVTVSNALIPGAITANAAQTIAYNTNPATISCSAATYGACAPAYTYQWQKSADNVNFTDISGQTALNLSFSAPLIATTYYRRRVTETNTSTIAYASTATVTVSAPFSTTTISPAVQNIFTGIVPAAMGGNAATGGSCSGAYTYQWQRSTDGGATFTDISGASGLNYTPPALTATTYYRRKDGCGSQLSYNNVCVVNVYQHVTGGAISPSALTITYGTDPGIISGGGSTGGMCSGSYAYQWQSSANNVTFTDIPGKTFINHSPGILTATTYFRRKVTCATETVYSNTAAITVNPQIFPGVITLNSMATMVNTSPGTIMANAATGGACNNNFVYQWQQSTDGLDYHYTDITGATGQNYTAAALTATTYFRRKVTCGIDVLYTNACIVTVTSATPVYNYIQARVITKAGVTDETAAAQLTNAMDVRQTTQYFDGLGRSVQIVNKQASPATHDIVAPRAYNEFGREVIKFLPYASSAGDGIYKATAIADQSAFYNPTGSQGTQLSNGIARVTTPYAVTGFESSALSLTVEQGAPGDAWQLPGTGDANSTGHTRRTVYTANDQSSGFNSSYTPGVANPGSRIAALYSTTINGNQSQGLLRTNNNDTYLPGKLSVTIKRDENWQPADGCLGTTEEYKDNDGHVLLRRTYNLKVAGVNSSVEMLSTYYVYDKLGNLAFVLPPGANPDATAAISQATLDNLCYQYQYDSRNRLIQKRIPGKGWEYMIYNVLDQVVATQDAVQRGNNQWLFTKYDALGRVIISGTWNNGNATITRAALQTTLGNITTNLWETPVNTSNGYTNVAWPTSAVAATLSMDYYDSYDNIPGLPAAYVTTTGVSKMTMGQPIAKKTAVLNTPTDMLWDVTYYDDFGRPTKSYKQHYLGGTANTNNYDVVTSTYDFTGAITAATRQHYTSANTSSPAVTIINTYTYDHMGRKKESYEAINGGTNQLLSHLDYNELSQLYQKRLHGMNGGQAVNANITLGTADAVSSGQSKTVTATNSITLQPGFAAAAGSTFNASIAGYLQTITYTYNERGWLQQNSAPLFAMQLKYNDGTTPQYNGNIANQLWGTPGSLTKNYAYSYDKLNRLTGGVSNEGYTEQGIDYDLNGNIMHLTRQTNPAYAYSYNGNQLLSVSGLTTGTYTYDVNGNVQYDARTGKTYSYNLLNLPQNVTATGFNLSYTYDASGQKLRKNNGTTAIDYIDGIQYENGAIVFIQTEEGRALKSGSNYIYEYALTDHLGNTRVSFDQNSATVIKQQDDYYPFGMEISRGSVVSPKNEYLYNKKELQEELGGIYDYGARFYDPVIGRWGNLDKWAEGYYTLSPYNFVANNPISFKDPDGKIITDANGNIVVVSTGKTASSPPMQVTQTSQNADGTLSATFLRRTYEIVNIFADNGTPIEALRLTGESQVNVTFDEKGQPISGIDSPVDHNLFGAESDCHGYTFTDGKLWIDDGQVESLLINDNYYQYCEESYANIVVFKDNGEIVHSAKRNEDGSYNNDAGVLKTEYNVSLAGAARGLTNTNNKDNVEHARKNQPNRKIDTNLGQVDGNGTRTITDKKEIAQFLKQITN
jgi:RHS repeat-associated protein